LIYDAGRLRELTGAIIIGPLETSIPYVDLFGIACIGFRPYLISRDPNGRTVGWFTPVFWQNLIWLADVLFRVCSGTVAE
jgi:hypothetical protein